MNTKQYDITQNVLKKYILDLTSFDLIPLIALLQDSFQNDTSNYEFKLEILKLLVTNLTRQQSATFIRIFENILAESPNNSIFRKNINPFRVGTIFISVLDDI